ncbi:ROK family transcriptional regulator [Pseudoruegeria sp. HB172150]|uniref:ROK family transcriptional regulator n=1 Tax=Pseudoruegeria sp. HB172150 TaxID=2721164 RepID=UPI0015534256|nr:ROK family protein [Pseudoruegeria sp. HB172150]
MIVRPLETVGANAERSRSHNRQVVLSRVRAAGQIGRAEIARSSGLSTQAVSNIIADLLSEDLIVECGRRAGVRGLPAVQYTLNPEGAHALGVEIRPDALFAAVLNLGGETLFSRRVALADTHPDHVTDAVLSLRDIALAENPDAHLLGAGMVMPGPFGATGIRESGSELSAWDDVEPARLFSDALNLPVVVENDANAAAMAERVNGAARGLDTYAFLYFGTGLGLGVVNEGRLVAGTHGNAGEIGHIPVPSDGAIVPLESAVSRLSVQRALGNTGVNVESGEDLAQLYAEEYPALSQWLDRTAEPLSAAVAIIENLFDPQAIILGGAMPDSLLDHMIAGVSLPDRSVATRPDRERPRLLRGASGRMTATLGAAALVINQAFTPMIAAR